MKGPEVGSLRSRRQGLCRQSCSPSIPADEMCGGAVCWGHRLTRGVYHSPGGMDILGRILAQGHLDTRVKAPATKPWAAKGQIPLEESYWSCKFWRFIPSPSLSTSSYSPSRQLIPQVEVPTAPFRHIPPLYLSDQHPQKQVQVISGCPNMLPPNPASIRDCENGRGPWGCLGNISVVHPPETKQKTYLWCQSISA